LYNQFLDSLKSNFRLLNSMILIDNYLFGDIS